MIFIIGNEKQNRNQSLSARYITLIVIIIFLSLSLSFTLSFPGGSSFPVWSSFCFFYAHLHFVNDQMENSPLGGTTVLAPLSFSLTNQPCYFFFFHWDKDRRPSMSFFFRVERIAPPCGLPSSLASKLFVYGLTANHRQITGD